MPSIYRKIYRNLYLIYRSFYRMIRTRLTMFDGC